MKLTRLWIFGWLLLFSLSQLARAQQFVPLQADGAGGMFSLMPMAGADGANGPVFLNGGAPLPDLRAQGNVAGRNASGLGTIEIGFDYLRPYWSFRDFTLAVPTANVGSFPLLGDVGHVDDHFALAPHLNYKYDVSDLFSIKATGAFMNLSGHIERTLTANDGSAGTLSANSSLTIITANLPEISTRFQYEEFFSRGSHLYWSIFDDLVIDLSVGTRYSSIEQNYTGKLNNTVAAGLNETTRYSHQAFRGVGLTTGLNFTLPVHERANGDQWNLFTNLRGSILVGDNAKDSTLSVTLAGMPGVSDSISQTKTEFIPVGEIELGAEWIHEFGDVLRPELGTAQFSVRLGLSGQVWGGVGPLSAGSSQAFRTSNLFLVGAHVMVGILR
jgi:hypothetical protein